MKVWKMISLFKQVIFRFHVNFPGCTQTTDTSKTLKLNVGLMGFGSFFFVGDVHTGCWKLLGKVATEFPQMDGMNQS